MQDFIKKGCGIYVQDSLLEGPVLTIMGGVHGNEVCGVEVLDFLRKKINIKKGKIILIYGNIEAIIQGKRQIQQNLNRMFKNESELTQEEKESYEYKRAQEIKPYLSQSDVCLDLHSSPIAGSPVFIICESNASQIIQNFPFNLICSGFDNIEPGGTDFYMNTIGKIGICIESGNHDIPDAMKNSLVVVREFLMYFGILEDENLKKINIKLGAGIITKLKKKEYFKAIRAYLTQTNNFRVNKKFKDFENIKKGQLIGIDGKKKIYADSDGKILFAHDRDKVLVEGFIEIVAE